jgi:hypothetical protein
MSREEIEKRSRLNEYRVMAKRRPPPKVYVGWHVNPLIDGFCDAYGITRTQLANILFEWFLEQDDRVQRELISRKVLTSEQIQNLSIRYDVPVVGSVGEGASPIPEAKLPKKRQK